MTHDEAKQSMAAEAYILDELNPAERNAFEEHFFDCTDCTADVLDAETIADGIRTGRNVVPLHQPLRYSPRWAVAAAAAVVAIGLVYINRPPPTRPGPTAPVSISATAQTIDLDIARTEQPRYLVVRDQPVSVGFIIPVDDPRPPYACELVDDAGHVISSMTVTRKQDVANPVRLSVPAGKFEGGHYTLRIQGDREIPPYDFVVEVH